MKTRIVTRAGMSSGATVDTIERALPGARLIAAGTSAESDWSRILDLTEALQISNEHVLTLVHHVTAERWRYVQPNPAGWLKRAVLNDVRRASMKAVRALWRTAPLNEKLSA